MIAAAKAYAPDARFIMASTGNVYDENAARPSREDDAVHPQRAYPASKVAAEQELRESSLNWSIQRFAFVYGDEDGHLEMIPRAAANAGWHPAKRMSIIHHRDIATGVMLGLDGAMDGRTVNITDEAPTSIYELATLTGASMAPSCEPLPNPWGLVMDGALARTLGFQPVISTVHQAVREGCL